MSRYRISFSDAKFAKFFASATLMAAATFAIGNIIQIVSSWYLGADAFAAMAAVYPYRLLPPSPRWRRSIRTGFCRTSSSSSLPKVRPR